MHFLIVIYLCVSAISGKNFCTSAKKVGFYNNYYFHLHFNCIITEDINCCLTCRVNQVDVANNHTS